MTTTHHYGPRFHLIDDLFLENTLLKLCLDQTKQPELNRIVELLYRNLIQISVNTLFPSEKAAFKTRMHAIHPESLLQARYFSSTTKAVCVNLARAGTYPSHICYDFLHSVLPAENIRQDHIFAARKTNAKDQVTGTELASFKIGGSVQDQFVFFPDPMGATGSTFASAIEHYESQNLGSAQAFIALNLIVTPEYLKKVLNANPKAHVFALRVDRGLSSEKVLKSALGLYWDEEKGLNEKQYIVPGAGGLGELLNNSFV